MKFDQLLHTYLGEFGKYQRIMFLLVCLPTIWTAMHSLSWTFTAAIVPHRCKLLNEQRNATFETDKKLPKEDKKCLRYANFSKESNNSALQGCNDGFVWDFSDIKYSAINRWSIVCDRSYIRAVVNSMYYVGQFFGSFVFGYLADKFGRKNVFISTILIQIICGTAMAFVPYWPIFAVMRMGLGFVHPGIFVIANVIGIEFLGPSKRKLAGLVTAYFYDFGNMILGTMAYGVRDYRYLQVIISLSATFMLSYYWIIPESPRWLMSRGRIEEADKILQKAAKINRVQIPADWHQDIDLEDQKSEAQTSFFDLFRTPNVRRRILISFFCWPVVSMTYYGIQMNPSFLGGGRYFTFVIAAAFAMPGLVLVQFTVDKVGRRALTVGGFLLCALCLLSTLAIPETVVWLRVVQLLVSKMSITAAYAVMYIYTPEMFPTSIRGTAVGSCSMMARVGSVCASYISMWLVTKTKWAMVLVFGPFTLAAGALALFLPETTGQPLPESMQDAENQTSNFKMACCSKGDDLSVEAEVPLQQTMASQKNGI